MAEANTPMISPGVRINLVDESLYTPSVSVADNSKAIVIVGAAQFGPFNRPVYVGSTTAFETIYGAPIDIAGLTAINTIKAGGTVYYCRFGDEATATAMTAKLGDLTLNATAKGTLHDGAWIARVSSPDSDNGSFVLEILVKNSDGTETTMVRSGVVSLDPASDNYYANWNNSYFELTGADGAATVPSAGDIEITAGTNGIKNTLSENAAYVVNALDILSDRDQYTFMYCFCPEYSSVDTVAEKIVEISNIRKDATFQIDHPTSATDDSMTNANAAEKIATFAKAYIGETYAWIAFWAIHEGYIVDPYQNNAMVLAPASAFIAPAIARAYSVNQPWVAPAGVSNLQITNLAALNKVWSATERDTLYAANVNPVLNYKGLGYTAMGQKNGQTRNSAMNRLNVSQNFNYTKVQVENISVAFLFAPIDDETFKTWRTRVTKFLSKMKTQRGLYDFKVKMDWETVTPEAVAQNLMPGIVKIKPTKTAEFIDVDVVIKNYADTL